MKTNGTSAVAIPMFMQSLPTKWKLSDDFVLKILSKIRSDTIGEIVRKDEHIVYIGYRLFKKLSHKKEKVATVYKSIRSDMRLLGILYNVFKSFEGVAQIHHSSLDMFLRDNFDYLCDAIDVFTVKEDRSLKAGLRQNLYYLLVKAVKRLCDLFFLEKKEELSTELDKFLKCLKSNQDVIVSRARYQLENTKLRKTRKPCQLPLEEDIKTLHSHIMGRIKELWGSYNF